MHLDGNKIILNTSWFIIMKKWKKNKWLSGEPVGDHTGEPNPNHYFEMKFNAEKAGINM